MAGRRTEGASSPILVIDVAHPPRQPDAVEEEIYVGWMQVRNSPTLRILKIIHGYGSTGKGGSTKETARNWLFRNKSRVRAIIEGEEYNVYNEVVQEMRGEVGQLPDHDLNAGNQGVTIVWVR
ncbi:MAG TPA: hypothetical protein VFG32_12620 [Bacteroidota bacterium]|nr:hypothetical protein [Bacteroidota bacterium]